MWLPAELLNGGTLWIVGGTVGKVGLLRLSVELWGWWDFWSCRWCSWDSRCDCWNYWDCRWDWWDGIIFPPQLKTAAKCMVFTRGPSWPRWSAGWAGCRSAAAPPRATQTACPAPGWCSGWPPGQCWSWNIGKNSTANSAILLSNLIPIYHDFSIIQ